ncbi:MAG TPA: hypothetical protein VL263_23590 [Vicinamibacterales bacterium]|nr:hypothetical protein [Vicinamibacterales bacterium]
MSTFSDRVFSSLAQFNGRLSAFVEAVKTTPPDPPRLPAKALKDLLDIADRARTASDAISRSFVLIDATALDIVDMQVRLQGETARLATALRDLGDTVNEQHFVRAAFEPALVALDEAAHLLAAAVFPSAVQGLREVNVKLWDFEKVQWKRYTDLLNDVIQRGRLPTDQQARIQVIADDIVTAFAEVNTLLNDLAETRAVDAASLRRRLKQAPDRLGAALKTAGDRLEKSHSSTLNVFGPVIKASAKVAGDVAALLKRVTIPIFPTHDGLGACRDVIAPDLYDGLSGVQAFALLNILARLQATRASGQPLLDGRHIKVFQAFPDRIYFEADRSMIDDIGADGAFEKAPASLHRFKEGSFKQTTFRKGNLQVSFASRPGNRVVIDADMDLYREAVPHLFGEVLVNHLTGSTTDQFKVREILDNQSIRSIGGFELLQV